jgi:hypothetical protein
MSVTLVVVLGCSRAEDKARQAEQAEAKAIAAVADAIRPLVARCEQLGTANDPPDAPKVLVIDLKDGARHKATDELPEARRGRSSDPDLLVFAVVRVSEERLKAFYIGGTDGIQVTAQVAAVRWPKKEPVGLYTVQAPPPEHVASWQRKGNEAPRGNIVSRIGNAIEKRNWPKSLSDKPEEFILGLWKQEYSTTAIDFAAGGTCKLIDLGKDSTKMRIREVFAKHEYHYKFVDPSTVELELASAFDASIHRGKKARISGLTKSSFSLTWEGKTWPDTFKRSK